MQLLALFSRCIYIAIISAPKVLSSSMFLERALFDVAPDDGLFSNEQSLEDVNSWDQDVGSDLSVLLADSSPDLIREFDPNQSMANNDFLDESASDFFLADSDVACRVGDAENTNLFGKVRRENVCRDPQLGGVRRPDEPTPNPFDAYKNLITITDPLAPFPPDSQTCSPRGYESSNIPVCKDEYPPGDIVPVPGTHAFTLYNIDPSMAKSISPYRRSQLALIESAKLNTLSLYRYVLAVSHCGVAKVFCGPYVFPQRCQTSCARILTYRIMLFSRNQTIPPLSMRVNSTIYYPWLDYVFSSSLANS